MELMTTSIWFVWMLFIGITAGLIVLEVFLARAERWWPGLIPPRFSLQYSYKFHFRQALLFHKSRQMPQRKRTAGRGWIGRE